MPDHLDVLLVEDDPNNALLLERALRRGDIEPALRRVATREDFLLALAEQSWHVIISDYNLPQFAGLDALQLVRERELDIPFIIASGEIGESVAVDTMRAGAHDYVLKDNLARLVPAVRREVREASLRRDRRAAAIALQDAEDRWRLVLRANNDGVWDTDLRSGHTWYSPRWREIFGLRDDDPGPQSREQYLALVHPDDRDRALQSITRLRAGASAESVERFRLRHADGTYRWVLARNTVVRDASGAVTRLVGTQLDISPQRRLAEAIHAIAEGTASVTDEEYLRHLVRELARLTGVRYAFVARLVGTDGARAETVARAVRGAIVDNTSWPMAGTPGADVHGTGALSVPSGVGARYPNDRLLADVSAECFVGHVLRDSVGVAMGHIAVVDDKPCDADLDMLETLVSIFASRTAAELRRATAVRVLQQREEAINSAPEAMFHIRLDGRIVWANDTACARLGYTREELTHLHVASLDPSWTPELGDRLRERMCSGEQRVLLTSHRTRRGDVFPVEITSSFFGTGDDEVILIFARDIRDRVRADAERRALQEALAQSQKMEALGTLAGGIAHDFNNILTGIVGNAELARAALGDSTPVVARLDGILMAVQRARDVVQRVLAFSRHQQMQRAPIRLADVVGEAMRLMRASLPSTIAVSVEIRAHEAMVNADASQMHQVLMNLCTNSAQSVAAAGGAGGAIVVSIDRVLLSGADALRLPGLSAGPHLMLGVHDTGVGLTDEVRQRIFEPFFTTKGPGEGTGLGLAVVHGIVHEHDGAIAVHSVPGAGADFRVYLPECTAPTAPSAVPGSDRSTGGGERILFVDDEPSIVLVGSRLLQAGGYDVTAYTDPLVARDAFAQAPHAFDVLVTDLTMPEMTGVELAQWARSIRPDLAVVVTTGYLQGIDAALTRDLRHTLLMKPYDSEALEQAVRSAVLEAARGA